jgi:cytochrome c-type biogenesis protein CcmE
MKTYAKFAVLVLAILVTLGWLAKDGINETKTYYKTIAEVNSMGDKAHENKLRVGGDVEKGSIIRDGKEVRFTLKQDALQMKVVYSGMDPLPDTFRDGAQALADGKLRPDGVFQASKIQAKCASKYEAKPVQKPAVQQKQAAI